MLMALLLLQSQFRAFGILLFKGYEMLKEWGWSWPAELEITHKQNCDMIRLQFRKD
jgi:hypothetical protein